MAVKCINCVLGAIPHLPQYDVAIIVPVYVSQIISEPELALRLLGDNAILNLHCPACGRYLEEEIELLENLEGDEDEQDII